MAKARPWPTNAEHARQECIAHFISIQALMIEAFHAMRDGDETAAAHAMGQARRRARDGQELLRRARSDVEPLPEDLADELETLLDESGDE